MSRFIFLFGNPKFVDSKLSGKILQTRSDSPAMALRMQIDRGWHGSARIKTSAKSVFKNPHAPPPPLGPVPGVPAPPNDPVSAMVATRRADWNRSAMLPLDVSAC